MRNVTKPYTLLDAAASTGWGNAIDVKDFRFIVVTFATDGGGDANGTVKFAGSIQDDVDFSTAQSVTNMWDYVNAVDLEDGSSVDGDTGVSVAGADDYRMFEIDVNALTEFSAQLSARSQGEFTIKAVGFTE